MAADQFVLQARPPVRAFAVAAVAALVGAGLMLIPATGGWRTLLIVVGIVLIVGAAALILAALAAARRQQVTVSLDEDGYRVDGAGGVRQGQWSDVTRVTASTGRITLHQGDDERVHLVSSAGQVPELDAIAQAISARLDDNRGYQVWAG